MSQRLKVLISAYACQPGKGSEHEVGWEWALQMARFHDVTVLTRTNRRIAIEQGLQTFSSGQPRPTFTYHDLGPGLLRLKKRLRSVRLYYVLWQRSAYKVIANLHAQHKFDLMHHVTFASYRYRTAICGHGVPAVWGPVGGIESIPPGLLPWRHPSSLFMEMFRNVHTWLHASPRYTLRQRARAATLIVASTPAMQGAFKNLGINAELMPAIGLNPEEIPHRPRHPTAGPLKLLFVGNILALKGLDLALEALLLSQTDASLTLAGDGPYLKSLKRSVAEHHLQNRVTFLGRLPRTEVLHLYPNYDAFLFPSLHDTGGYAVIEAMSNELPVICLDCGGPALAVQPDCGFKVPLGPRREVIRNLAAAIQTYTRDRKLITLHGQNARQSALKNYNWQTKAERLNNYYSEAIARYPQALLS